MRPIQPQSVQSATDKPIDLTMDDEPAPSNPRRWRSVAEILALLIMLYGLATFAINTVVIDDDSMRPNLASGQQVFVNRLSYRLTLPARGDVVALRDPRNAHQLIIRRVLGLPGELLDVVGNQVSINGRTLTEVYLDPSSFQVLVGERQTTRRQYQLGENEYFVLSDKRASGIDSRDWGAITPDAIEGRAWLIFWPPENINFITHFAYEEPLPLP